VLSRHLPPMESQKPRGRREAVRAENYRFVKVGGSDVQKLGRGSVKFKSLTKEHLHVISQVRGELYKNKRK